VDFTKSSLQPEARGLTPLRLALPVRWPVPGKNELWKVETRFVLVEQSAVDQAGGGPYIRLGEYENGQET
jgi:hypothetical protein